MRDFEKILKTHHYWKDANWNATYFIYTFETGSKIEFFSSDNGDKLRGARRDRLFINEANNVTFDAFQQLEVRTKDFVFIDFNPTNEFWVFTEVMPARTDWELIILTYNDNEALDSKIIASIEQRKTNKNWWRVFGEGQLGQSDIRIFRDWQIIDELPHEAKLVRRGLDFGFTNDPSAITDVYKYNGGFIFDEALYQKGMSNKSIADVIMALSEPQTLVVADSSEPKSIDELKMYGVNIIGASKGAGSVNQGIQFIQDQRISVTKRSINLIKEYRNYVWITDKSGKILNTPEGGLDHCIDSVRYALSSYRPAPILSSFMEEEPQQMYSDIGI